MATHKNFSKKKQLEQQGWIDSSLPESNEVIKNRIKNIDEWVKQIWYFRTHLDIFIELYLSHENHRIKLKPFQKVIIRQIGNCQFIDDVESRGLGKTFKMALVLLAMGILYPDSQILIVSKTARQALLTVKYIKGFIEKNPNIAREIKSCKITKDRGDVLLKNKTTIEAMAMNTDGSNIRGLRRKIVYIDEAGWVASEVIKTVLMPMLQLKRDVYWKLEDKGFQDYNSKLIQTSSAYLKSCEFFERFKNNLTDMKQDENKFVCAIPYSVGVREGILDESFVLAQKKTMPINSFEMEWNARFVGSADGACFPYDLTEPCRVLERVELIQPRNSKTAYVISLDIATSESDRADNASITVIKMIENTNKTFKKEVVNLRTYHGFKLEELAMQLRIFVLRFPNVEKIIIDINGLGEGMLALLNNPFVDDTNKEHPPLILDDSEHTVNGCKIIRGVRANNVYNNRMATATRMYLENKSLKIPITSNSIRREFEGGDSSISKEQLAIFIEADALQYEMGNIVSKITPSGNIVYETSGSGFLKDRYTSLGMALEYILEKEELNKKNQNSGNNIYFGSANVM